ncbi:uncharacterized protein SPPG_03417 [Spizellomyces punctatus DAOM BR117]|uniref:Uncharacterized protein n=1 Tax=Spizellomyces punctatus (strain DAOM BR117) TaxID=645134 RepID=A0A0L0HLD9_SPIPD|nr:uncharacterized protein SPPG_03417 [Spizellomyces punctatus DAOM BR117]KND01619.1 hypothetical protein SPPG_03417 [Spizellomyces punctatus DAOM BR117]|eukprot:XP_016609658.1 hypothetical protein SPPG_03417 [Spizellomyces punctatus DAOM BR117]
MLQNGVSRGRGSRLQPNTGKIGQGNVGTVKQLNRQRRAPDRGNDQELTDGSLAQPHKNYNRIRQDRMGQSLAQHSLQTSANPRDVDAHTSIQDPRSSGSGVRSQAVQRPGRPNLRTMSPRRDAEHKVGEQAMSRVQRESQRGVLPATTGLRGAPRRMRSGGQRVVGGFVRKEPGNRGFADRKSRALTLADTASTGSGNRRRGVASPGAALGNEMSQRSTSRDGSGGKRVVNRRISNSEKSPERPTGARPRSVRRCSLMGSDREMAESACTAASVSRKASIAAARSRRDTRRASEFPTSLPGSATRRASIRPADNKDVGGGWNKFISERAKPVPTYTPSIMHDASAPAAEGDKQKRPIRRRGVPVRGKRVRADLVKKTKETIESKTSKPSEIKSGKVATVDQERARQLIALLSGATYEFVGTTETARPSQASTESTEKTEWLKANRRKSADRGGGDQSSSDKSKQKMGQDSSQKRRGSKGGEQTKSDKRAGAIKSESGHKKPAKEGGQDGKTVKPTKPRKEKAHASDAAGSDQTSQKLSTPLILPPLVLGDESQRSTVFKNRPVTAITEEEEEAEIAALLAQAKELQLAKQLLEPNTTLPIDSSISAPPIFRMPFQTWGIRRPQHLPSSRPPPLHQQPKYTYKTYMDNLMHPNILLPPFQMPPIKQILYGPYEEQLWRLFYGQAGWISLEELRQMSDARGILLPMPLACPVVPVTDGG